MGEIADGLINGDFDCYTGEYLGEGDGFPRSRHGKMPWQERVRKSEDLRWKKVTGFLSGNGFKQHTHPEILKGYGVKYTGKRPLRNACFEVLKDFKRFKEYVKSLPK
jgi:hypothetical protein